jgi:hypothetical protein
MTPRSDSRPDREARRILALALGKKSKRLTKPRRRNERD